MDAGYEHSSAINITVRRWFLDRKDKLRRKEMLSKAEKNLDKVLEMTTSNNEGNEIPDLLRIKVDVSKTIVTTLGKNEGYSTRIEQTGADGKDLPTPLLHVLDKEINQKESSEEQYELLDNNSNKEDKQVEEEN